MVLGRIEGKFMTYYSKNLIARYATPVPRYTSYPTAPHFNKTINEQTVKNWMSEIPEDEAVSIYIHIPFCDRLCWFCGCHTKHTLKYDPIRSYLSSLYAELLTARKNIGRRQTVSHIHLGGGSPSILRAADLEQLRKVLDDCFIITDETEISLELDPTDLSRETLRPFVDFGLTRASIGVQDFDPKVQTTINRVQSFEKTHEIIEVLREFGVESLNIDALYGLPYQDLDTVEASYEKILSLNPDRIALFGYAHVPWIKPHQKMIPEDSLPDLHDRFWQNKLGGLILAEGGYNPIGIDHFAKTKDSLAVNYEAGKVRRNFQGYTTDNARTLLGFGTSAISEYPQGYAQNVKDNHSYRRALSNKALPIDRGIGLSQPNRAVSAAINELMTYFSLTSSKLSESYGTSAIPILKRAKDIAVNDRDGFFVKTRKGYRITPRGRPFTRTIASYFDEYLETNETRYSIAV